MSAIEEIKQKTDIVEVIGQYVKLTKSGRNFRAPCPFHSEKNPSFFVYPERQSWHCFGACSTGGDVFSFIMKKEGLDFKGALSLLADRAGVVLPSPAKSEVEERGRERLFQINQAASQYFYNLLLNAQAADKARRYLETRGVNSKSILDFQIGYSLPDWEALKKYLTERGYTESELVSAGLANQTEGAGNVHDRFRDHLMFPIMDERGRVVGFGARVIESGAAGPKYINSPQTPVFEKSGSLYGIHLAKTAIRQQDLAILVEGYMDVIIAHQFGFANVIAPMGVAITERQMGQIKKLTRNIALALDPDKAGEDAALRTIEYENSLDTEVKVISLPEGKDPDEVIKADPGQWQSLVSHAVPVIESAIRLTTAALDMKTTAGRMASINQLLPIIAGVKSGPRQYDYLTKLSLISGIDTRKLEAALGRYRTDRKLKESRQQGIEKAVRSIHSSPLEEHTLTLLLQHPEFKERAAAEILDEYFESSENREIFDKLRQAPEVSEIGAELDPVTRDHFLSLLSRNLPDTEIEHRFRDYVLRLRERYLRNLEEQKAEALALAAEAGGHQVALEKQMEQGTEISSQLLGIFAERARTHGEKK